MSGKLQELEMRFPSPLWGGVASNASGVGQKDGSD